MGWLDDAQKKIKEIENQDREKDASEIMVINNERDRESLKKELRNLYENATINEIERAIDYGLEKLGNSCNKKEFLKTVRIKLED